MSQKTQNSSSLQSSKSLSVDFRFVGLQTSHPSESSDVVDPSKDNIMLGAIIPENGDLAGDGVEGGEDVNNMDQDTDESPYSRFNILVEGRPSVGDEDLGLTHSPLRSFVPMRTESKWSDTNAYAAKK
ncbi:hypothetical protein U1Q18_002727, partial [Sarracenia purpurea var. burkii]